MKALLIFGLVFVGAVEAAIPDSIAGYKIHLFLSSRSVMPNGRGGCIEFDDSGHFSERYVTSGFGYDNVVVDGQSLYSSHFEVPATGSYVYVKTSDTSATLTLTPITWTSSLSLDFSSDLSGSARYSGTFGNFFLVAPSIEKRPLSAVATRVRVRNGDNAIVGFRVERGGDFLLRVGGPVLSQLGVKDVWAKPRFDLYDAKGRKVGIWSLETGLGTLNADGSHAAVPWDASPGLAAVNLKAFLATNVVPFSPGSKDLAVVTYLEPGAYTMVVNTPDNDEGGNALIEVYEIP